MQRGALSPVLMSAPPRSLSAAPASPPFPAGPSAPAMDRPGPVLPQKRREPCVALDSSLRWAAVAFKGGGSALLPEKKFREAIGKVSSSATAAEGGAGSPPWRLARLTPGPATSPGPARLSEEQRRLVENTEVECYDFSRVRPSGSAEGAYVRGADVRGTPQALGVGAGGSKALGLGSVRWGKN